MTDTPDALEDGAHRPRPNPTTHRTVLPPDVRGKLNFIVENLNVGITPMRMILDGDREVDVIAFSVEIDDEYLYQPLAVFVDDNLEARLSDVPEPEE